MPSIKKELEAYGLTPRKRWGQHFLVDRNILGKVLRAAEVGPQDVVLEVGPGLGEMTLALAHEAGKVMAVEIDRKMIEVLKQKVSGCPNVEVIQGDILKLDFHRLFGRFQHLSCSVSSIRDRSSQASPSWSRGKWRRG
jgi:16S rRNA (adenine1518-N6/adenine1519-N6)-dimethyltransferase